MIAETVSGDTYRVGLLHRHATSAAASAKKGCIRSRAEAPWRVDPETCKRWQRAGGASVRK